MGSQMDEKSELQMETCLNHCCQNGGNSCGTRIVVEGIPLQGPLKRIQGNLLIGSRLRVGRA